MKLKTAIFSIAVVTASVANAQSSADSVRSQLQGMGYTNIEVERSGNTARGEKRLPSEQNQAILKSSGRPLGECRTTTCSGRFKPCPSRPAGHVRGHYDHGGINSSNISILRSGVVRWILPAPYVLKEVLLWFGNVLPMIKTVRLWSGYSSE